MNHRMNLIAGISFAALAIAGCEDAGDAGDYADVTPPAAVETVETMEPAPVEPAMTEDMAAPAQTIVAIAAGNGDLSTLVAAVTAAELVDTLNSDGPFTVFAPPNTAFEKLPEGTVASLLMPENKATLASVLTYHVVAGEVMAADLVKAIEDNGGSFAITTVQGGTLTASIVDGAVKLTDTQGNVATVVATDVDASNGVVHVIDTVVMPG